MSRPAFAFAILVAFAASASAQEQITVGEEGKILLKSPAGWKKVQPKVRIIEHEFAVPAAEGDKEDGRVTIMGAGGGVQANVDRWLGQFAAPEGKTIKEVSSVRELKVGANPVHIVDVTGTYKDAPAGPFGGGKAVLRENYRLLGAIMKTDHGDYFIKFYGPKKTVDGAEKAFNEMVNSLEVKK